MIDLEHEIASNKAFIFGFDNVIYPEKDYLLQVYYLFSEFMAYSEQMDSGRMLAFMQAEFSLNGADKMFEQTAAAFEIPEKYKHNFSMLHESARLPLKLLMYKQVLTLLQEVVVNRGEIIIIVEGNPIQQLNKIKQLEWHGLEQYLRLYFTDEFEGSISKTITYIITQHQLQTAEMLMFGAHSSHQTSAKNLGIKYLDVNEII